MKTFMWIPNRKHDMGRQENNFNYGRMKGRDLKDRQWEWEWKAQNGKASWWGKMVCIEMVTYRIAYVFVLIWRIKINFDCYKCEVR